MPAIAVLIVLLSVATILLYGFQATRTRLAEYAQDRAVGRAVAVANAVEDTGSNDLQDALKLATETGGGQALFVNRDGEIVARAGKQGAPEIPDSVIEAAARGDRITRTLGERRVVSIPVIRDGELQGGIVFVADGGEMAVLRIFSRSNVEAAAIASVIGGGLMLLVAALLSRRVERLTLAASSIQRGDLSARIKPGYGDELSELARTFNAMAERLEESFRRVEEGRQTLDAILNNLGEGVLATSVDAKVVFINRAAREMLGLKDDRPNKVPDPFADLSLPEAVARCAKRHECGEARVRRGDKFFRINLQHMPAFDEHRGGVLVVLQDLSEGKRLEASQQRFLANAAHELKTPITSVLGASTLLLTEERDDPQVRAKFLKHIHTEAERMRRLSETLLRLARTGWDLRDPKISTVDLEATVHRAAERMAPLADANGVMVSVEGSGDRVRADEEWLEQALLVLVSNAVKHSERGGLVRLRLSGNVVTVEDEGEGISEEDLPHVFERFYSGRSQFGGFGLGLPICRDLIERMEGKIYLESEVGVGTSVEVELREVRDE
jgi:two-component system phosphate regulon sensor histidine kinase PhoR